MTQCLAVELLKYPKIERIDKCQEFYANHDVVIQEKIDGSNVGIHVCEAGTWGVQSRNQTLSADNAGMFSKVFDWCRVRALSGVFDQLYQTFQTPVVLYGEMIGNGKLRYEGAPDFILFDVYVSSEERYLAPDELIELAQRFKIDYLPYLYRGPFRNIEHVQSLIQESGIDNSVTMEGVVVKAYGDIKCWYRRASDDEMIYYTETMLAAKCVREDYQEVKAPRTSLKTAVDPLAVIVDSVVTEARIRKAAQRAEEMGKDIRKPHNLIPLVAKDVHEEESELIKEMLFKAYWKPINKLIAQRVLQEV